VHLNVTSKLGPSSQSWIEVAISRGANAAAGDDAARVDGAERLELEGRDEDEFDEKKEGEVDESESFESKLEAICRVFPSAIKQGTNVAGKL